VAALASFYGGNRSVGALLCAGCAVPAAVASAWGGMARNGADTQCPSPPAPCGATGAGSAGVGAPTRFGAVYARVKSAGLASVEATRGGQMTSKMRRATRPTRKRTTPEELAVLWAQREAEQQGRAAVHQGNGRDSCPYPGGDPLRERWLAGFDAVSKRGLRRPDMRVARSAGYFAFVDGLDQNECSYPARSESRTEWLEGWESARRSEKGQWRFDPYR
jgi:ribosome modulation factor